MCKRHPQLSFHGYAGAQSDLGNNGGEISNYSGFLPGTVIADNYNLIGHDGNAGTLVTGSPAADVAPTGPATDQRGVTGPQGLAFDIGIVIGAIALRRAR